MDHHVSPVPKADLAAAISIMSNLPEIDCPRLPTWQHSCGDKLTIDDK